MQGKIQRYEVMGSKQYTRLVPQRLKSHCWQQTCEWHTHEEILVLLTSSTHNRIFLAA